MGRAPQRTSSEDGRHSPRSGPAPDLCACSLRGLLFCADCQFSRVTVKTGVAGEAGFYGVWCESLCENSKLWVLRSSHLWVGILESCTRRLKAGVAQTKTEFKQTLFRLGMIATFLSPSHKFAVKNRRPTLSTHGLHSPTPSAT
jgi:hypothetical protein